MTDADKVTMEELSREEQLELQLAESRLREARLVQGTANRAVTDGERVLADTHGRLVQAALQRRASAAAVPATPPANRASRRRAKSTKKS